MPQKTKTKEFCLNLGDEKEIQALGGPGKLLDYYTKLVADVRAKPSVETDKHRAERAAQLKAGMPFLHAMSQIQSRKECSSADWIRLVPESSREELSKRSIALTDEALKVLREFKAADTWKNVF